LHAFQRQALHAQRLTLAHPGSGRQLSFEAPLPTDFEALLAALRADTGAARSAAQTFGGGAARGRRRGKSRRQ
jgi:hypothetical protein